MSQCDRILAHLQTGASLTPASAFTLCGSYACHSRIAELRARGWRIDCRLQSNGRTRYGVYTLVGPRQGELFSSALQQTRAAL